MRRDRLAHAADDWPPSGGPGPRGSTLGGDLFLRVDALAALSDAAASNYRWAHARACMHALGIALAAGCDHTQSVKMQYC